MNFLKVGMETIVWLKSILIMDFKYIVIQKNQRKDYANKNYRSVDILQNTKVKTVT